ncbi:MULTISPECIES: sensor histidine kinase [unclassified Yoonia]|uniref:sensor histidine kinase n=1 Tax=unclassified Yoonia TaxID=2629118 RepID=UPI002AFEBE1D|nr:MULTISPECIES: HWE histidine kinase domain-containing protein [unclassified Yoonia]
MPSKSNAAASDDIWDEQRLRIASEAAGVALWSWHVDTDELRMDARAFEIWGIPPKSTITFEELSTRVFPADVDKVRDSFNATREVTGPYEIDFRILHGEDVRWVSARGRGDDEGIRQRIMHGVFLDVTYRKLAEEERELITKEMNHRIKNLFSVSSSLASIAARSSDSKESMLQDLTLRLRGLAAAHELILPTFNDKKHSVTIRDLLTTLLKAYMLDTADGQTVHITGDDVTVGESSIKSIAMLIHELATNSVKYGALSQNSGQLTLTSRDEADEVQVEWHETGAPPPADVTKQQGFGSEMMDRVIRQVNGSISRDWTEDGLIVTLRMDKALLSV